jgi:hypothetical protein
MRRGIASLVLVLTVACADEPPPLPFVEPTPFTSLPLGWKIYETRRIRFAAPDSLVESKYRGTDSLVRDYESTSLHVGFDFGLYSDKSFAGHYDGKRALDAVVAATRRGDLSALRAEWHQAPSRRELPRMVGLYVKDVDRAGEVPSREKLYFTVAYRDEQDAEVARRIVDSVETAPAKP